MVKLAGSLLAFMGLIHTAIAMLLFADQFLSIWNIGFGGGLEWDFAELAAFWFLIFGWLMCTTGILVRALADHKAAVPALRMVAYSLVGMPILCGLFLPASGLWLMIIPGMMIIRETR